MPYVMLFLNRLVWLVQNFLMFHLQLLAVYFQGLSVLLEGDRVTGLYIEQASYTTYRKEKFEEHMSEGDTEDDSDNFTDGESEGDEATST